MNPEKLKEILRKHKDWIDGNDVGEKADLRWADLSGADLSGADLGEANLRGAKIFRKWKLIKVEEK